MKNRGKHRYNFLWLPLNFAPPVRYALGAFSALNPKDPSQDCTLICLTLWTILSMNIEYSAFALTTQINQETCLLIQVQKRYHLIFKKSHQKRPTLPFFHQSKVFLTYVLFTVNLGAHLPPVLKINVLRPL